MVKVSLVTTVLNEEENINNFLNSVINQSIKPSEFIVVDAGSTDKTLSVIEGYSKIHKWMKLIKFPGASRGIGRNKAIEISNNKLIAVTDAGLTLDKDWLKDIIKPFENKNVDVVSGVTFPLSKNNFEFYQGLVVYRAPNKLTRMSSRSLAFRKKVWFDVGGYPSFLYPGEDTYFNLKLKGKNYDVFVAHSAKVYWNMRPNLNALFKQFYSYGFGDRKSGNIFKLKFNFFIVLLFYLYSTIVILSVFYNLFLFLGLISLVFLLLFVYGLFKVYQSKRFLALLYCPFLFAFNLCSYIFGITFGGY